MSKQLEVYALALIPDHRGETSLTYEKAKELLEQYGRECLEAAAKQAEKSADGELDDYAAGGAYSAAESIRHMELP